MTSSITIMFFSCHLQSLMLQRKENDLLATAENALFSFCEFHTSVHDIYSSVSKVNILSRLNKQHICHMES